MFKDCLNTKFTILEEFEGNLEALGLKNRQAIQVLRITYPAGIFSWHG